MIFSSINTSYEIIDFFEKFHFSISNDSISDLKQSQVFEGTWNRTQLFSTLKIACELGKGTLCCFAHDADPIYIMTQK